MKNSELRCYWLESLIQFVKTICYNKNVSSHYYADDGFKLTVNNDDMQCLLDLDSNEANKWNLYINANEANIAKYTRKKYVKQQLKTESDLNINNRTEPEKQTYKFGGLIHNFDNDNFTKNHLKSKIKSFRKFKDLFYFISYLLFTS